MLLKRSPSQRAHFPSHHQPLWHRWRVVLVALLLVATLLPWPAAAAPDRTRYTIEATIDFHARTVAAREQVHVVNRTGVTLADVVLTATPAHWGGFQLDGVTIGGVAVPAKLEGVMLTVPLPTPLPPNGAADLEIVFRLTVPIQGGRYGFSDGVLALGNWFPILAVYRTGRLANPDLPMPAGWDHHRYVDIGDAFFTETADYDVRIKTDPTVTVAHTGELVARTGGDWHIRAENVRDFGLALSDQYETRAQTVGNTTVTVFLLPGHRAMADLYLRAATEMLAWLSSYIGPYPSRSLHVAEVGAGTTGTSVGQEYPNLVFISSGPTAAGGGIDSYLAYLVLHEVAHQWFYGLIGDDQLAEPWLDEALVTWLSMHFYRHNYPDRYPAVWQSRILGRLGDVRGRIAGIPVNSSIYDYQDENLYFTVVYRQGAVFLEEAYQRVGEATMHRVLQRFDQLYRGRIATGTAFLDLLQSETAVNLSPLFAEYFSYPRYQQPEPLRFKLVAPDAVSGPTLSLDLQSDAPLGKTEVFVDDMLAWTGVPTGTVTISLTGVDAGDHLLTVVASDDRGRRAERAAVFQRIVVPTPTPTPSPTPAMPPTPTATARSEPALSTPARPQGTPTPRAAIPPPLAPGPFQSAVVGGIGGLASLGLILVTLVSLRR